MNAAQQATDIILASKIAAIVSLFCREFPDAKVDLKPWAKDRETQQLVDPDSIDLSFHFPGWSRGWQSRSILVQILFYDDKIESTHNPIGIEVAGFDSWGKKWRLSTIHNWQFEGELQPNPEIAEQLREFCRQTLALFDRD